tara:strand:+ start:215 stop:712 length:498 start_codon:yes stop_codon:yes gene_type:complete
MFKKFFLLIIFVLTTSCGFEAIHSKANRMLNSKLLIAQINYAGDREVNIKIKERLSLYSTNKLDKDEVIDPDSLFIKMIDIESSVTKEIIGKDAKGNASIYQLKIKVIALITKDDDAVNSYQLERSSKYDSSTDSTALRDNEREIKRNLAEAITGELVFKLTSGQ